MLLQGSYIAKLHKIFSFWGLMALPGAVCRPTGQKPQNGPSNLYSGRES